MANRDLFHSIDLPFIVFNHPDWKPIYLPHSSFLTYNIYPAVHNQLYTKVLTNTITHTHIKPENIITQIDCSTHTHTQMFIFRHSAPFKHTRTHCGCLCIVKYYKSLQTFYLKILEKFMQRMYNLDLNRMWNNSFFLKETRNC